MKKFMDIQEYAALPTLEELRQRGLSGRDLIGIVYRSPDGSNIHKTFKKVIEIRDDQKIVVTKISDIDIGTGR